HAPARVSHAGVQVRRACATIFVRVWPHCPTLSPSTASVVCRRVPPRDDKPLRELGRNYRDKAGGLRAGSVSIEPKMRPLLSGDGINPNNLTMPQRGIKLWFMAR